MTIMLIPLLLLLLTTLIIPTLIVVFWKKRPVLAYILAVLVMLASVLFPTLAMVFGQMMEGGVADPLIFSESIAVALSVSFFCLIFLSPILAVIQWMARRKYVRNQKGLSNTEVFE